MSLLKDKIELQVEEAELLAQKSFSGLPTIFKWLLSIGVLAIIPGYFIAKNISLGIWRAKYSPGQIQAKPSFTNPKDIIASAVTATSIKDGSYAAVLKITNPNLDLSLDQVPYKILFYNSNHQEIYSYSDNLFLLPNQSKYLTVPTFAVPEPVAYATPVFPAKLPWQKRLNTPKVNIIVSQPISSQQYSPVNFVISGDFTNQSPYVLKKVRLAFVIYDINNQIIAVSQRDEFALQPFEKRSYTQLWPNSYAPTLGKIEIQAYTDVLDSSNLSAPSVPTDNSSDLSRPKTSGQSR